jgi:hypothetical protein
MKTIKQKIIVDESGSMHDQQDIVINGFNEQLVTMRQEEKNLNVQYLITLIKFADEATMLYKDLPLEQVPNLNKETYIPSGWTALYDAIGMAIDTATLGETDVLVTIFTDGQDNKSKTWKKSTIKTLIELRQNENKWGFVYFGANQNTWAEAQQMGVRNAVHYTMQNTDKAMSAMGAVRSCYTSTAMSGNYCVSNLIATVNTAELVDDCGYTTSPTINQTTKIDK